jgi:phosphate uptake regulator
MLDAQMRRVQVTGRSTHIVSLPIDWVRRAGVKRGDLVAVVQERDGSLRIVPEQLLKKPKIREALIPFDPNEEIGSLVRRVIAHYALGFDVIKITSKGDGIAWEQRRGLKKVVHNLIGLEVIEEAEDRIVLRGLLEYLSLSIMQMIERIHLIVSSMHADVLKALGAGDSSLLKRVIERDDEVDHLYLLTTRELVRAIRDQGVAERMGINIPTYCLAYMTTAKTLERIADNIVEMAKEIIILQKTRISKDVMGLLLETGNLSHDIHKIATTALLRRDAELASKAIAKTRKLNEIATKLRREVSPSAGHLMSTLYSIQAITNLGMDIAKLAINFAYEVP